MPAPEQNALHAWFELQERTLQRLHPSWLPGVDAELLAQAGEVRLGRRWLASRLAPANPALFGDIAEAGATGEALRRCTWIEVLMKKRAGIALDLGVRVLAPALRTVVTRAGVLNLRNVLGLSRYESALRMPAVQLPPQIQSAFAGCADDAGNLIGLAQRCGACELAGHAGVAHPAWGDSVRLSFERRWWEDPFPLSLPPELMKAVMHEAASE